MVPSVIGSRPRLDGSDPGRNGGEGQEAGSNCRSSVTVQASSPTPTYLCSSGHNGLDRERIRINEIVANC